MAACAATALFIPHFVDYVKTNVIPLPAGTSLNGSLPPGEPVDRTLESLDDHLLFNKLAQADRQWQPQEELLPDGSIRYLYKRRSGEPDLTVSELRALIESPRSYHNEQAAIDELLDTLRQAGVRVLLTPTLKRGAAAEWDHSQGVMRIQPDVMGKGSVDFLRVLSHEAVHVAQSCRAGSLRARPSALGVPVRTNTSLLKTLDDPIYADTSTWEKGLELEAYGLQNEMGVAKTLVTNECLAGQTALLR
ncbi:MAG: hypothetical protein VKP70_08635 [Cyanobacteriota bacterium]|nr:hypothetical protein [Cyanobacteriota bacterium]